MGFNRESNMGLKITIAGYTIFSIGGVKAEGAPLVAQTPYTEIAFPVTTDYGVTNSIEGNLESGGIVPTDGVVTARVSYGADDTTVVIRSGDLEYTLGLTLTENRRIVAFTHPANVHVKDVANSSILLSIKPGEGVTFTFTINVSSLVPQVSNSALEVVYGIGAGTILTAPPMCSRIQLFSNLDPMYGSNLTSAVFRSMFLDGTKHESMRRPELTQVVSGKGCTLQDKVQYLNTNIKGLVTYGLLRYYLWYLITGSWDICILLQLNTGKFFHKLERSEYRCWSTAFEDPRIRGYDKYYI